MIPFLRGARAAFVFLTRIPVGGFPYSAAEWQWSSAHFPLVGAVLGAIVGAVAWALQPLGALGAAFLALGTSMLLTGAFHEDGLADTSDAMGGAFDREKLLLILKDSRIGTFGGCALAVSIGARAALIARLGVHAWWALPLVGCAARVGPIWQMVTMPYATARDAKSRDVTRAKVAQGLVATGWMAAAFGAVLALRLCAPARALSLLAVLVVVTAIASWRFLRRVGGVTGDFLGATEQLCEVAALAVLAWGPPA